MKKTISLIALALSIYAYCVSTSCAKKLDVFTEHWQRYNYIDTNIWNEAVFCDTNHNRHYIDTVPLLFLISKPLDKLTGDIQFQSRTPYKDSLFVRHVIQYLKRID